MVRVRIAVVVNERGDWVSAGWMFRRPEADGTLLDSAMAEADYPDTAHTYWIEADLPKPGAVIEARVAE